jgi:hypothetical protein
MHHGTGEPDLVPWCMNLRLIDSASRVVVERAVAVIERAAGSTMQVEKYRPDCWKRRCPSPFQE